MKTVSSQEELQSRNILSLLGFREREEEKEGKGMGEGVEVHRELSTDR